MTSVLVELARTLVADFSIQDVLDRIARSVVDVLGVEGAGVLLLDDHPDVARFAAATSDTIVGLDTMQIELGQGPSLTSYATGAQVVLPDLVEDGDFPDFSRHAVEAGIAAVFTFPLRLDDERIGALGLYESQPRTLDPDEVVAAQILADVAAVYLFNARARSAAEERTQDLHFRALHDALTLLPNRALLALRLAHALSSTVWTKRGLAVLFIDIDNFKAVNDVHGHPNGDVLLVAVAERLKTVLGPGDTLARLSGDEFVMLCEQIPSQEHADALAAGAIDVMQAPFTVNDEELRVEVSVGVATTWDDVRHDADLITHADAAMDRAKRAGGNQHWSSTQTEGADVDVRRHVVRELKHALEAERLELYYQPIVDSATGEWRSVEALLRWEHPVAGAIPPELVVDVAEGLGLTPELSTWTLGVACQDLVANDDRNLSVAVNASPRQLLHPRFTGAVREALRSSGLDAERLCVEITEGALIHDVVGATAALESLRAIGVTIALDDFGTGYSSLSHLKRLPVDVLKIDRSFITALQVEPMNRAIISAVVTLADIGDFEIVAEGVETEEQMTLVHDLGCHQVQGYHVDRPFPVAQLAERSAASRLTQRAGDRPRTPAALHGRLRASPRRA